MKNAILLFLAAGCLNACGSKGKSGADIANEVCDCSKKANALDPADPQRTLAQNDCLKKQREAWEKLKDDPKKSAAFNEGLQKCAEEQLNKSLGK